MRVTIPANAIAKVVRQIGGHYRAWESEGIAEFRDPSGWVVQCIFSLSADQSILVDGPIRIETQYRGTGNRHDPIIQPYRESALADHWPQRLACTAMLAKSTALHGESIHTVIENLKADDEKNCLVPDSAPETFRLHNLGNGWAVLEDNYHYARTDHWLDNEAYLVKDELIYIL